MPFLIRTLFAGLVATTGTLGTGSAWADLITYPNAGAHNPVSYNFTAGVSGRLKAYFVGGVQAWYENQLGVQVNGVAQGDFALDNHASAIGDSHDFGLVRAGDKLVFVLHDLALGKDA